MTSPDFKKSPDGLLPAVVQDALTLRVLMLGYMNQEALDKTRSEGKVTFFSRSKNRLWTKGETSGNFLAFRGIKIDCDRDTILISAEPHGHVCHTGADTCFNEENSGAAPFLSYLQKAVIRPRKSKPEAGSYTSELFSSGLNKIAQKVGEESVELIIEAKDDNIDLFRNEAADLLYHLLILLEEKNVDLDEVISVLRSRNA